MKKLLIFAVCFILVGGIAQAKIESVEDINTKTKKFKCVCDKTGKKFERIKKKDSDGHKPRLSNTEAAFCDEEMSKFIKWLKKNGYGGDCWCGHISEYIGAIE